MYTGRVSLANWYSVPSLNVNVKSGAKSRSGFGAGRVVLVSAFGGGATVVVAPSADTAGEAVVSGTADVTDDAGEGTDPALLPPQAARTRASAKNDRKRIPSSYDDWPTSESRQRRIHPSFRSWLAHRPTMAKCTESTTNPCVLPMWSVRAATSAIGRSTVRSHTSQTR